MILTMKTEQPYIPLQERIHYTFFKIYTISIHYYEDKLNKISVFTFTQSLELEKSFKSIQSKLSSV